MAVPQNKVTRSRRNMRRAHDALVAGNPAECPNCGAAKRSHTACSSCGYVRPGLQIKVGKKSDA